MQKTFRTLASTFVLVGAVFLGAPHAAFACEPEGNGGCSSCSIHMHPNGDQHSTCCSWDENGDFMGCEDWIDRPNQY